MEYIQRIDLKIADKLRKSEKYRRAFFKARCRDEVVLQIKSLRKERKLSQERLAERMGMVQSAIVRIEDPDYAQWTFTTLQRVAEALDACWEIRLRKSEDVIKEAESTEKQEQKMRGSGGTRTASTTERFTVTFGTPSDLTQFAPYGAVPRRHFYRAQRASKTENYINFKAEPVTK